MVIELSDDALQPGGAPLTVAEGDRRESTDEQNGQPAGNGNSAGAAAHDASEVGGRAGVGRCPWCRRPLPPACLPAAPLEADPPTLRFRSSAVQPLGLPEFDVGWAQSRGNRSYQDDRFVEFLLELPAGGSALVWAVRCCLQWARGCWVHRFLSSCSAGTATAKQGKQQQRAATPPRMAAVAASHVMKFVLASLPHPCSARFPPRFVCGAGG